LNCSNSEQFFYFVNQTNEKSNTYFTQITLPSKEVGVTNREFGQGLISEITWLAKLLMPPGTVTKELDQWYSYWGIVDINDTGYYWR
jgi:hypothetical protein